MPAARAGGADRRGRRAGGSRGSARRGKYLVWELSDDVFLLMHLRMTGTLLLDPDPPPRHVRVRLELGDHELVFDDPRRFGTGELALGPEALDAFFDARLGVEPLERDFTGEHLYSLAQTSRAPVKAFLLDQKRVAGVGNIYADEALFRARVHPLRPANRLTRAQCAAIRDGVVESLLLGLEPRARRSTTSATRTASAAASRTSCSIHLREHEPCLNCGNPVRKLRAAGAGPTSASAASRGRAIAPQTRLSEPHVAARQRGGATLCRGGELRQAAGAIERDELLIAADALAVDYDLGERHHARQTHELRATLGVLGEVDLLVGDAALGEEGLGDAAVAAGLGRVDGDLAHDFRKYSAISGSVKTEGIVLRSHPLRRSGPDPPLVYPDSRPAERDRQRACARRSRASAGGSSRSSGSTSCSTRAAATC